jgi:uncharacterized SAM-binding protein YcdF (DUF218 family)
MNLDFWKGRKARWAGVLLAGVALVAFGHVAILREIGAFLIVEDSLRPAAAIIALGGEPPFREMEAARLYREGWASRVIVVRGARNEEWKAFRDMGIVEEETWERSRKVLIRQGVPPAAILVPNEMAEGTLEELKAAYRVLGSKDAPVILVTSKFHTRRTRLTWHYVTQDHAPGIVRAADRDPFDPNRWWRERRFILSVVREYLGLFHYYLGFPVGPRAAG